MHSLFHRSDTSALFSPEMRDIQMLKQLKSQRGRKETLHICQVAGVAVIMLHHVVLVLKTEVLND